MAKATVQLGSSHSGRHAGPARVFGPLGLSAGGHKNRGAVGVAAPPANSGGRR
jgi:hypothetical protein